jgi:hypothetical protein
MEIYVVDDCEDIRTFARAWGGSRDSALNYCIAAGARASAAEGGV